MQSIGTRLLRVLTKLYCASWQWKHQIPRTWSVDFHRTFPSAEFKSSGALFSFRLRSSKVLRPGIAKSLQCKTKKKNSRPQVHFLRERSSYYAPLSLARDFFILESLRRSSSIWCLRVLLVSSKTKKKKQRRKENPWRYATSLRPPKIQCLLLSSRRVPATTLRHDLGSLSCKFRRVYTTYAAYHFRHISLGGAGQIVIYKREETRQRWNKCTKTRTNPFRRPFSDGTLSNAMSL